jgi:nicotinate phosphoribosyltransferase
VDQRPSTALLTDRYELTMLDAARADGTIDRPCVFELFARRLPEGRRFAVAAGLARALDAIADHRFDDDVLAALDDDGIVSEPTLAWLAGYRFRGDVWALPEGDLVSPNVPALTVSATFGEAVVLETVLLSILNHDTAVASAAARMVAASDGRPLLEFGSRRTHEAAAVHAARAAVLVGFAGTSNLEAGRRYGVRTMGTSAHAYTLVHDDEPSAFRAQVAALGHGTTLLVDTYDVTRGLRDAVAAGGPELGAVRIDCGDLASEAHRARALLDELGNTGTRIVVSGDLDEHRIAACRGAPIDAFGVGTAVVTGSGAPTAEFVYKLVARARTTDGVMEPVAKAGGDKATVGGQKAVARRYDADGVATADVLHPWGSPAPAATVPLQVHAIAGGERRHDPDLEASRAHHRAVVATLPRAALELTPGPPALATVPLPTPPGPSRSASAGVDADHPAAPDPGGTP